VEISIAFSLDAQDLVFNVDVALRFSRKPPSLASIPRCLRRAAQRAGEATRSVALARQRRNKAGDLQHIDAEGRVDPPYVSRDGRITMLAG